MTKLSTLLLVALVALPLPHAGNQGSGPNPRAVEARDSTAWSVRPSLVLDTVCLLNVLTGDPFYVRLYEDEYARFAPQLTPAARASLAALRRKIKDESKNIISAFLTLHFSATDDQTLDDMLRTLKDSGRMKERLKRSDYYNEAGWRLYESVREDLKTVISFLRDARFEDYWRQHVLPKVLARAVAVEKELRRYDVVREVERHLGFPLSSRAVTVYLLHYARPHGIRLTGTRFVADASYSFRVVLQNAIHEMLHPPYRLARDRELRRALYTLRDDAFLSERVRNHNPSFGYNSFEAFVEEDCVRALDQLIGERLGIASEPRRRWREEDEGMHVLAVALYSLMRQEGFGGGAESFRDFLLRMIRSGKLAPGRVETLYRAFYQTRAAARTPSSSFGLSVVVECRVEKC